MSKKKKAEYQKLKKVRDAGSIKKKKPVAYKNTLSYLIGSIF
jgi:hypothetical protein